MPTCSARPTRRPVPPIIAWTPYGKHVPFDPKRFLNAGVKDGDTSKYTAFEAPDPTFWIPHGYAVVVVDTRGTWYSEGTAHYLAPEEAQDFYDAIEWAGTQPWSNGKVGLSGVSYLAQLQWRVAELNPPHLAAINPWEGWTDSYREVATHGGIPDTHFWPSLWNRWGASKNSIEDLETETERASAVRRFLALEGGGFLEDHRAGLRGRKLDRSGPAHARHVRGLQAHRVESRNISIAHGQKKWAHYYVPENMRKLHDFFDHFLKGVDNDVKTWPKVTVEVRERNGVGKFRAENEWPLARTQYTQALSRRRRTTHADASRSPDVGTRPTTRSCRNSARPTAPCSTSRSTQPTELTGYMKLRVFMSCAGDRRHGCVRRPAQARQGRQRSCRSPTTRSSMTGRSRSAGCAPRTASSIR